MAVATVPIVLAPGAVFIAEILIAVLAIAGLFRCSKGEAGDRLNTRLIAAAVLLLGYSTYQLMIGLGGPFEISAARLRSYAIFLLGLALVALWRPDRTRVLNALAIGGSLVALMVIGEILTQTSWDARRAAGNFDPDTLRPLGPLSTGGTATLLLASFYASMLTRRWLPVALAAGAIALLGSRAHMLGAVVLVAVAMAMVVGRRRGEARKQFAVLFTAIAAAALLLYRLLPSVTARLQTFESSRTQIWRNSVEQWWDSGWATILGGVGPAGPSVYLGPEGTATFAHNQYIDLVVEAGLVGLLVVITLVATLLTANGRRDLPLVAGMLVVCLFGEMLIGATPGLAIGAIAVYAIVFSTVSNPLAAPVEPETPSVDTPPAQAISSGSAP